MKRIHVIVVITNNQTEPETFGNLRKICKAKGWKYNTVSRLKFPFEYKGFILHKTVFQ
jgi:hypothetical protein